MKQEKQNRTCLVRVQLTPRELDHINTRYNKPTLKFLQKQFARNLMERINRQEMPPPIPLPILKESISLKKEGQRKRK
jgi:hypothetical protein